MEPQMPVSSPFDTLSQPPMPTMTVPSIPTTPQPSFTQPTPPPTPAFAIKMEADKDMQTTTTTVQTVDTPRKKWIGYPLIGLITIIAWIILAAQQYGLGNLIPYPLSGLIASWLIILVGLWLLAKGRLGRIIAFWLWLAIVTVVGAMIYDTVYPGTLPRTWSRGIIASYDKTGNNLTLNLGTIPFSWSDEVITPPTPLDDTIINPPVDDTDDSGWDPDSLSGYTITVTWSNNSWAKK